MVSTLQRTDIKDILSPSEQKGEVSMGALILCPICEDTPQRRNRRIQIDCMGEVEMIGLITCLDDKHQMSVELRRDIQVEARQNLPVSESALLIGVPLGLVEDVHEAERAYLFGAYKACVVMCRRALQLALREKKVTDAPLSKMLANAKKRYPRRITEEIYSLAMSIKNIGDKGAHRKEQVTAKQASIAIYATADLLRALFPKREQRQSKAITSTPMTEAHLDA